MAIKYLTQMLFRARAGPLLICAEMLEANAVLFLSTAPGAPNPLPPTEQAGPTWQLVVLAHHKSEK